MKDKCKRAMKRVADWFRNHPITSHLLVIALLFVCLAIVAFVVMALGTRHNSRRTVPNFVGLTLNDAKYFAERRDLQIVINDSLYVTSCPGGVILEQLPDDGAIVKPGRKIYVTVNSLAQRKVDVPYVAGRSLRQAKHLLETSGFTIEHLEYVDDIATNYVLAEFVNGEEVLEDSISQANIGSGVVLRVGLSANAKPVVMPKLMGLSLFEAKNRLWELGLNVGELVFDAGTSAFEREDTKVYEQSVQPDTEVRHGDKVSLLLTLDTEKMNNAIAEYERRIEEEKRAQMVADSIAMAEQRLLDSIANAVRATQPQPKPQIEDNFFF